jgi:hypothetical protein
MARTEQRAMQARLAEAGRRIDQVASRAESARDDTRVRVELRVDALREAEAEARKKARAAEDKAEARAEDLVELAGDLDAIDIDIAIAVAQLDLDSAESRAAFEAAVEQEIAAYQAYVEHLQAKAGRLRQGGRRRAGAVVSTFRDRTAAAAERLQRFRNTPGEASDALRAGVLAALDDLDHAAVEAWGASDTWSGR